MHNRLVAFCLVLLPSWSLADAPQAPSPMQSFAGAVTRIAAIVQPVDNETARVFVTSMKVLKAEGLPKELVGAEVDLAFQSPDHLWMSAAWKGHKALVGRDEQELWVHVPEKH